MRTESKDIKAGDVIEYRTSRGLLVMEVESVKVNSNTYDKNNCGVHLYGYINSNNFGPYVAKVKDDGNDYAKLPLRSSVNVTFNFIEAL